jgi:hypothetical protein
MCQRQQTINQALLFFLHLLVFLVSLSCFTRLCCVEEKSNRFSLTRQGLTLFHVSHQVFVRTVVSQPNLGYCIPLCGFLVVIQLLRNWGREVE